MGQTRTFPDLRSNLRVCADVIEQQAMPQNRLAVGLMYLLDPCAVQMFQLSVSVDDRKHEVGSTECCFAREKRFEFKNQSCTYSGSKRESAGEPASQGPPRRATLASPLVLRVIPLRWAKG